MDETLLDWAHEEATAASAWSRPAIAPRAMIAVVRALTISIAVEARHAPWGWFIARTSVGLIPVLLIVAASVAVTAPSTLRHPSHGPTLFSQPWIWPPAVFLAVCWRPGIWKMPAVTAAVAVCLWLLATNALLATDAAGRSPVAERPVLDLFRLAAGDALLRWAAIDRLLALTGYPVLAALVVLLGGRVLALSPRRGLASYAWLLLVPAIYAASCLTGLLLTSAGLLPWLLSVITAIALFMMRPMSAHGHDGTDAAGVRA
jgi:hypothetical protein